MTLGIVRWFTGLTIAALAMGLILTGAARAQTVAGDWHGTLSTQGVELRIGVTIEAKPDGALSGRITSPDQGPQPMPITEISSAGGALSFSVAPIQGRFDGKWDAARNAWVGSWRQFNTLPLTLEKGPVPSLVRTQVPAKPYPYREEEVAFDSVAGVKLAGTLTLPPGKGPFPAAVLISGSGPQNRDEELVGHRPFLILADHLTRKGVAVLRYDDRGFAKSTGKFGTATTRDFAEDAAAAVAFLRTRPDIDARKVGLVGHSEGGMIAPMVAVRDPKVAFVVLLAGPGAPIGALMDAQRRAVALAMGQPADKAASNAVLMEKVDRLVLTATDLTATRGEVQKLIVESASGSGLPQVLVTAQASAAAMQVTTPWYQYFIGYDPRLTLAQVRQPILAINGSKDVQVVAAQNLPAIREATKANRDVTIVELPGLNHLFQDAETGSPVEYAKIAETMSPKALETVSTWIVAHTRR